MTATELIRAHVHAALEEATGEGIHTVSPLADELLAAADRAGALPGWLFGYIYSMPAEYSAAGFEAYAAAREKASEHVAR